MIITWSWWWSLHDHDHDRHWSIEWTYELHPLGEGFLPLVPPFAMQVSIEQDEVNVSLQIIKAPAFQDFSIFRRFRFLHLEKNRYLYMTYSYRISGEKKSYNTWIELHRTEDRKYVIIILTEFGAMNARRPSACRCKERRSDLVIVINMFIDLTLL